MTTKKNEPTKKKKVDPCAGCEDEGYCHDCTLNPAKALKAREERAKVAAAKKKVPTNKKQVSTIDFVTALQKENKKLKRQLQDTEYNLRSSKQAADALEKERDELKKAGSVSRDSLNLLTDTLAIIGRPDEMTECLNSDGTPNVQRVIRMIHSNVGSLYRRIDNFLSEKELNDDYKEHIRKGTQYNIFVRLNEMREKYRPLILEGTKSKTSNEEAVRNKKIVEGLSEAFKGIMEAASGSQEKHRRMPFPFLFSPFMWGG